MKFVALLIVVACMVPSIGLAAKVKTVEATYVYYAPPNQSPQEAMTIALQRAQIQAIADEFGTVVAQENTTRVENSNSGSSTSFFSLGTSVHRYAGNNKAPTMLVKASSAPTCSHNFI